MALATISTQSFSTRPDTPEPGSQQGRRNTFGRSSGHDVQLLDGDGEISAEFEACLAYIFGKYCTPSPAPGSLTLQWNSALGPQLGGLVPRASKRLPPNACMTSDSLDRWAKDTNGTVLADEMKREILEYMDTSDQGHLTFKGMCQIYRLQTTVDEEDTWRDLASHGFDRKLELVSTRREDNEDR